MEQLRTILTMLIEADTFIPPPPGNRSDRWADVLAGRIRDHWSRRNTTKAPTVL
jgi:hypothetical protein